MKGNGEAYHIWNKDQVIATANRTMLGQPCGDRPPVSDSALIRYAFFIVFEFESEKAVSETELRISFFFLKPIKTCVRKTLERVSL